MMTIMKFAAFISAFLFIMFGTHYLLYTSIVRFISIEDPGLRRAVMWIIVFLAVSFFPSALLLRLHVNIFTTLFYYISSIWLGLFMYLLMALALIWVIFGVGKLVGFAPDMRAVSIGFFLLAAAISAYGLWRAHHPGLKHIEVKIEGLPDHWRNRTVVHLSDLHLGVIHGTTFMQRVAEKVNSVGPDLILITGDLFDGMGGDLPSFIEPLNGLKASKGVFFVTGNHEGYLGLDKPLSVLRKTHIRVLDNEIAELEQLQIIGISFPEYHRENGVRRLLSESGTFNADKPSILLYHTPTNIGEHNTDRGSQQTRTYWRPDTSMNLVKQAGIDLQLSGHTHRGQIFPFGFLTRAIYNGFDYGLHRDGGFHLYVSSGVGTWGPPMRIGSPPEIVTIKLR